jgi:cell shape-determining protein MreC
MAITALVFAGCGESATKKQAQAELETEIQNLEKEAEELEQLSAEIEESARELEKLLDEI